MIAVRVGVGERVRERYERPAHESCSSDARALLRIILTKQDTIHVTVLELRPSRTRTPTRTGTDCYCYWAPHLASHVASAVDFHDLS